MIRLRRPRRDEGVEARFSPTSTADAVQALQAALCEAMRDSVSRVDSIADRMNRQLSKFHWPGPAPRVSSVAFPVGSVYDVDVHVSAEFEVWVRGLDEETRQDLAFADRMRKRRA